MSIQGTGKTSPTSPSHNRQRLNRPIFSASFPETSEGDYFFRCETHDLMQEIARLSPVQASHEVSQKNISAASLNSSRSQPQMSAQPQAFAHAQASESYSDDDRKIPADNIPYSIMLKHKDNPDFIIKCTATVFLESLAMKQFKDFVKKNLYKQSKEVLTLYRQENPNSHFYHEVFNRKSGIEFQKMTDEEIIKFIASIGIKLKKYKK